MTILVDTQACPCGKAKQFQQCCGRFIAQGQQAKTAEQLMRSRYSAYALGGYGEYLLKTWYPATAKSLTVAQLSIKELEWCGLELIAKAQRGNQASVEFKAWYLSDEQDAEIYQGQRCKYLHERSAFTRVAGRWFYVGGEIFN